MRAAPTAVMVTMASIMVDVPEAPVAPALPSLVLAIPVMPAASNVRSTLVLAVVPMVAEDFSVAVAPAAPVPPDPDPVLPFPAPEMSTELLVALAAPAAPAFLMFTSNAMATVKNNN